MTTSKVSLPPIRQMLFDISRDHKEDQEPVPKSSTCSHSTEQLNYRQAPLTMKQINSINTAFTFDSWHECLSPPLLSPVTKSVAMCQCPTNDMIHTPSSLARSPTNNYAHHHRYHHHQNQNHHQYDQQHQSNGQTLDRFTEASTELQYYPQHYYSPSPRSQHHHRHYGNPRHRRTYSASSSARPSFLTQVQPGVPYHLPPQSTNSASTSSSSFSQSQINDGVLHRGRTRAHTTSGYLPTTYNPTSSSAGSISPHSDQSSTSSASSSSSSSLASLSPTSSSTFMPGHPSYMPMSKISTQQQQQQQHYHAHTPVSSSISISSAHLPVSHQQRHRYHCPHCNKTFSRPSSLRIHIYSHTGEKPHVCPYFNCGRRFSVQSNMRRHIRVHAAGNMMNNNNNNNNLPRGEHRLPLDPLSLPLTGPSTMTSAIDHHPSHHLHNPQFMLHGH